MHRQLGKLVDKSDELSIEIALMSGDCFLQDDVCPHKKITKGSEPCPTASVPCRFLKSGRSKGKRCTIGDLLLSPKHFEKFLNRGPAEKYLENIISQEEHINKLLKDTKYTKHKGAIIIYGIPYVPTVTTTISDDNFIILESILPFSGERITFACNKVDQPSLFDNIVTFFEQLRERGTKLIYANEAGRHLIQKDAAYQKFQEPLDKKKK